MKKKEEPEKIFWQSKKHSTRLRKLYETEIYEWEAKLNGSRVIGEIRPISGDPHFYTVLEAFCVPFHFFIAFGLYYVQ